MVEEDSHIKWILKYETQETKTVARVDLLVHPVQPRHCF